MTELFRQLLQTLLTFAVVEQEGSQFFGLPDEWKSRFLLGLPDFRRQLKFDDPYRAITVVRNQTVVARGRWDGETREVSGLITATLAWLLDDGRTKNVERNIIRLDAERFLPGDTVVIRFLLPERNFSYNILQKLLNHAADEWVYAPREILREHGYEEPPGPQLRAQVVASMARTQVITNPPISYS